MGLEELPGVGTWSPGGRKRRRPEPQRHVWFDGWMTATGPGLQLLVEKTIKSVAHHEQHTKARQRARRSEDEVNHLRRIEALTCALAHAVLIPPPTGRIAVKLGHGSKGRSRYHSPVLGKALSPTVHLLWDLDILDLNWSTERGEVSSIAPTAWFARKIEEFGVQLSDFGRHEEEEVITLTCNSRSYGADGRAATLHREPIDYDDTPRTRKYRADLRRLNAFLRDAEIDFLDDGLEPRIDPFDRRMRRRFIILPDQDLRFDQGGRLFGGFWQGLKRGRRKHIRIGGEPVRVLDYSSMFTRLAYADIGEAPPEGDLYAIPGFEGYRSGIKLVMNALLFDKGITRRKWPDVVGIGIGDDNQAKNDPDSEAARARLPGGATVKKTKEAILSVHPALKQAWGRQLGYQLMFRESEILMEVLRRLAEKGVPALGLHDGLMVSWREAQGAAALMAQVGKEMAGLPLPVTSKRVDEE